MQNSLKGTHPVCRTICDGERSFRSGRGPVLTAELEPLDRCPLGGHCCHSNVVVEPFFAGCVMSLQFSVFPRRESPGFLIYHTACALKAGLGRAFRANGLGVTPEQWSVLSTLWEEEGMHQSRLASKVAKDRHNMTRILNLLEKNGFVEREPSPADKRCHHVYLTSAGKELTPRLIAIVTEFLTEALGGLSDEDLAQLRRLLERILRNVEGAMPEQEDTWHAPCNDGNS